MVNQDTPADPVKALEYKERGNKCFQVGDWAGAEALYTKAINHDPSNPLLYTNRSMALLKLLLYQRVISDSLHAISLLPLNMKAYFQLAQAQIALHDPRSALASSKKAHELCVEEIYSGGKGASSIGPITELVLKCKKEDWERREEERVRGRGGLLGDVLGSMRRRRDGEMEALGTGGGGGGDGEGKGEEGRKEVFERWRGKMDEVRRVWELSGVESEEGEVKEKRAVPDWCVDDITFAVMLDPVVTKTGQSYDRASIMEHLKRSPTDPLTREPLRAEDLRPNLALREAIEEFLGENGWATDW